ncbi:MAG: glycoside hydrolase family 127 protein [Verrucomicrobia bacterium]|nr:glycoside hydrolase family 127 protein [Verrucomicrobiota bacterium]
MKSISLARTTAFLLLLGSLKCVAAGGASTITIRDVKGDANAQPHYVANRAPLAPSPFVKLPIGSITPKGWLRHQLDLEKNGMTGRLKEISPWLKFETNAWANKEGQGERGWEEMPYWLKGYGDLGYVLKDEVIIAEARQWIEAVMSSQREDGWFGPRDLLTGLKGKPDLWPHMVMLNILQSYYEFGGDERVLPLMTRYFKWENQLPATAFGEGYWPKIRAGDNIESAYWLYNRTGEPWLLELARKIHENMARWDQDVINWHNVNIAQGFRAPTVYWMQARTPALLQAAERNYQKVMDFYGQFPGGGFAGDENCRPGYTDPRQGFETCGIIEFMHSFEMLTKISGNPVWSDRCEEIAFNSLPAALTPDWKGLHYLTCANQVQLDRTNKSPAIENEGAMFSYSPFQVYRCCQHNVSHGWPYYAEELWLATHDRGLCASLYAASEVTAKVADGSTVRIAEETDYPFSDTVRFRISTSKPIQFPLYLRIPRWCQKASVKINGKSVSLKAEPLSYAVINQTWKDGDTVALQLPMQISVRRWPKNQNAASVDYGPLTFSLKIGEKWTRYGGTDAWPELEVFPTTPWNYGLEFETQNPQRSFKLARKTGPLAPNPFTPETTPIVLSTRGRRIPAWEIDRFGMAGKLQPSPVKSSEPLDNLTLIPMGAARLRITSFPVVSQAKDAREWANR